MYDIIYKTPRLFRVLNLDTAEVFTTFARNKDEAVSLCPIRIGDDIQVEEVMASFDGVPHHIFQLRHVVCGIGGIFFRTVNCNTLKVGKTVWLKKNGDYDHSTRKYCCVAAEDICKYREFKSGQWVITT